MEVSAKSFSGLRVRSGESCNATDAFLPLRVFLLFVFVACVCGCVVCLLAKGRPLREMGGVSWGYAPGQVVHVLDSLAEPFSLGTCGKHWDEGRCS